MDKIYDVMMELKHHFNVEYNEINHTRLRKILSGFESDVRKNAKEQFNKTWKAKLMEQSKKETAPKKKITLPTRKKPMNTVDEGRVFNMVMSVAKRYRSEEEARILSSTILQRGHKMTLDEIAKVTCELHGIPLESMKKATGLDAHARNKGNGTAINVSAREDFVRLAFHKYLYSTNSIRRYLGFSTHSAILYMLYGRHDKKTGARIMKERPLSRYNQLESIVESLYENKLQKSQQQNTPCKATA